MQTIYVTCESGMSDGFKRQRGSAAMTHKSSAIGRGDNLFTAGTLIFTSKTETIWMLVCRADYTRTVSPAGSCLRRATCTTLVNAIHLVQYYLYMHRM